MSRRPTSSPIKAPFINPAVAGGTIDTDEVVNVSGVPGATASDALDDLDSTKAEKTTTITAGAGLTGGGDLSANRTLDVAANADGSITVNANDIQVGILATDAQHGVRGGGTQHAVAVAGVSAGFMSAADKTALDAAVPNTRTITAGAGLTGGGDLSANRTLDVAANADGSITVNANDIQVGILATDAQHGVRGGGTQHAVAVAGGAAGFLSGTDKTQIDKYGWGIIESETQTLINAMSTRPTSTVGLAINNLIVFLKSSGWWDETGYLLIPTLQDEQASLLNWKNPTQSATNNGCSFTAYQGFTATFVDSDYISTVDMNTVSGFAQNTNHHFAWSENGTSTGRITGEFAVSSIISILPYDGTNFRARDFCALTTVGAVANRNGLFHVRRVISTEFKGYKNGTLIGTPATASSAGTVGVQTIFANNANYSDDRILAYGIGGNSVATPSDLYDALVTFYDAIGCVHS